MPSPEQAAGGDAVLYVEPPADLTDRAREVWDVVVAPLCETKTIKAEDVVLLIEFCESLGMARHFRKTADAMAIEYDKAYDAGPEVGEETKDWIARLELMSGQVKRARAGYVQTVKVAQSLAGDLGMGPVTRVRLGLAKVQGMSLLDVLQQRRNGG